MDLWTRTTRNEPQRVAQLLDEGQVPVDDANDLGETALHLAAARGYDQVVHVLLQHGADLLAKDSESGWTPLHRSVYHDQLSTSLLLLRHARMRHGRKFMNAYLYETLDFAKQSAMDLVSGRSADQLLSDALQKPTRGGSVYTFGKVDFQLGYHLPNADVQCFPRRVELPISSPIVQISASKYHTVAVNGLGQCFSWGFGKGGRLGTGTEFDHVEPTQVLIPDNVPIQKVAAGENHTLALSLSGQVYSWGSNSFGQLAQSVKTFTHESRLAPKRVDAFRGMVMVDIAASGCHSAAICGERGALYTWGSNKKGQLGRKEGLGTDQVFPTPKIVDGLVLGHATSAIYEDYDDVRAIQVALSDAHTTVILQCEYNGRRHGQIWHFGYGSAYPNRLNLRAKRRTGSLLLGEAWMPSWKHHELSDVVQISCAQNHSIALTACGAVFTWGHNGSALSHGGNKQGRQEFVAPGAPQRVPLTKYGRAVSICASHDHCAVVSANGDLVTWGCGSQGVLGHGQGNTWQPSPKRVQGVKKVVSVAAGHQHTVVLVAPLQPTSLRSQLQRQHGQSMETVSKPIPSLMRMAQSQIASYLDLSNAVDVWKFAEMHYTKFLQTYCFEYLCLNWDAILEVMGKERHLESLFELVLPPLGGDWLLERKHQHPRLPQQPAAPLLPRVAIASGTSELKHSSKAKQQPAPKRAEDIKEAASVKSIKMSPTSVEWTPSKAMAAAPVAMPKSAPMRRKASKFVPLDAFLSSKSEAAPSIDASSPWQKAMPTPKEAAIAVVVKKAPSGSTAHLRKGSIGSAKASPSLSYLSSPPAVAQSTAFAHDGITPSAMSTFSLDAFIKKPSRKSLKKKGLWPHDEEEPSKPMWSSSTSAAAGPLAPAKTLQEIQAEEEARVAAERAAIKARRGVEFVRPVVSTVNSWGLCAQASTMSLSEVQKLQEHQDLVDMQQRILDEIQRENEQKKKAAAAGVSSASSKQQRKKSKKEGTAAEPQATAAAAPRNKKKTAKKPSRPTQSAPAQEPQSKSATGKSEAHAQRRKPRARAA